MTDLGLFFRQLRQRFRREIKKVAPQGSVLRRYRYDDVGGRLGIREIYRLLLGQASRLGVVRQYHETPNEYARRLGQAVPEGSVPLSELTYLYNTVRYGDLEAEAKQVDYANNLWAVLRRLLGKVE